MADSALRPGRGRAAGGPGEAGAGFPSAPPAPPPRRVSEIQAGALGCGAAVTFGAIGAAQGGYFPTAWGWCALAFGLVAIAALGLRRRLSWRPIELVTLGVLAVFVLWVGLSIVWSEDVPQSVLELERGLVYLLAFAAALLVLRRQTAPALLGGVLLAATGIAGYALGDRFFPDEGEVLDTIATNRLSTPIGYWNALAIFAAMAALLALGFAARARTALARGAAAAALPILLTALYYTYSRGGWLALAIGAIAAIAIDPRRLQLLLALACLAPWSALAVYIASQQDGLTHLTASHDMIVSDGREMTLVVLGLAAVSCAAALGFHQGERRLRPSRGVRRGFGTAVAVAAGVALIAVFARYGDPISLGADAWTSFAEQDPAPVQSSSDRTDLNQRLFSLRGNGRVDYWKAAWEAGEGSRLVGIGAGAFEQDWNRERTFVSQIRDAHGLWQEQAGELGLIGVALLATLFGIPLLAALRARGNPLAPAVAGAYVAYLAHTSVDWDWEVPAVTLTALMCAAALLFLARRQGDRLLALPLWGRLAAAAVIPALIWFSVIGLIGNEASSSATAALDRGDWAEAEEAAEKEERWAPWSGAAWRHLGLAQAGQGDYAAARASLRRATEKDPTDWSIWYDLGNVSRGAARRQAYVEAARRNPLAADITVLRDAGYTLPPPPEQDPGR